MINVWLSTAPGFLKGRKFAWSPVPHVFFWLLLCWAWRIFTDSIGWLILVPRLNLSGLSTIFTCTAVQNWNSWSRYWKSKSRALVLQDLKLLVLFLSTFTVVSQCVQTYLLYYSRIQMFHHHLCPHCMQPCSCFLSSDAVSYASKYFCATSIRSYMILLRWRTLRILELNKFSRFCYDQQYAQANNHSNRINYRQNGIEIPLLTSEKSR